MFAAIFRYLIEIFIRFASKIITKSAKEMIIQFAMDLLIRLFIHIMKHRRLKNTWKIKL